MFGSNISTDFIAAYCLQLQENIVHNNAAGIADQNKLHRGRLHVLNGLIFFFLDLFFPCCTMSLHNKSQTNITMVKPVLNFFLFVLAVSKQDARCMMPMMPSQSAEPEQSEGHSRIMQLLMQLRI